MTEVLLPLLATPNLAGAQAFYGALFGWTFAADGTAFLDGDQVAELAQVADLPAGWLTYLSSSDVDSTTAAAVKLGATIVREPAGQAAVVRDPTGATVGFRQPAAPVIYQPGAACWHELLTDDLDESDAFYTALFPLHLQDIEDGTAVLRLRNHPVGGRRRIVGRPRWQAYFWVEDIEHAVARVAELGGTVRHGPLSSHHGSLAGVSDPFGARFTVIVPTGW